MNEGHVIADLGHDKTEITEQENTQSTKVAYRACLTQLKSGVLSLDLQNLYSLRLCKEVPGWVCFGFLLMSEVGKPKHNWFLLHNCVYVFVLMLKLFRLWFSQLVRFVCVELIIGREGQINSVLFQPELPKKCYFKWKSISQLNDVF